MESIRDFVCPHGMKQEEELLMGEARLRKLSENYPDQSEKPENVIEQDLLKRAGETRHPAQRRRPVFNEFH